MQQRLQLLRFVLQLRIASRRVQVFAAQRPVGQGAVTLVGVDPATDWFAGTPNATAFWRRCLPASAFGAVINPLVLQDDSQIVAALSNLPAVDLPDLGVLFALLLLYIALIGPLNYLVLRRLDRRLPGYDA